MARIALSAQEQFAAPTSDAIEVDLRFGEITGGLEQADVWIFVDDLAREILDVFRQSGICENRDAGPWRRALREARALPNLVRGPVLFRALARFASICRAVVMRHLSLEQGWLALRSFLSPVRNVR
jgi:hypothetical protein